LDTRTNFPCDASTSSHRHNGRPAPDQGVSPCSRKGIRIRNKDHSVVVAFLLVRDDRQGCSRSRNMRAINASTVDIVNSLMPSVTVAGRGGGPPCRCKHLSQGSASHCSARGTLEEKAGRREEEGKDSGRSRRGQYQEFRAKIRGRCDFFCPVCARARASLYNHGSRQWVA